MDEDCCLQLQQCLLAHLPDDFVKAHILPHILMTQPLRERMRLLATLRCVSLAWKRTIDDTEELYYAAIELEQEERAEYSAAWEDFWDGEPCSDDDFRSD